MSFTSNHITIRVEITAIRIKVTYIIYYGTSLYS
nr:MAG TPA: hypothetical protein [Bacteriophage sp.]